MDSLFSYVDVDSLLFRVIALLISLTLHDALQSAIALRLGDRTAREQGRLSLNPLVHLDPLGLAAVIFGPYGWSRPVPLSSDAWKRHRKLKSAVVYLSGPVLYACLAVLCWWLYSAAASSSVSWYTQLLNGFLHYSYIVNALLCVIGLIIPFYPSDLWKTLRSALLERRYPAVRKYEWIGLAVTIPILVLPVGQRWLEYMLSIISHWIIR